MTTEEIHNTALHESGHSFAATAYRIANFPRVTPDKPQLPNSTEYMKGICHLEQPMTQFQAAVIGWAGVLAVCMFGEPPAYAPPFKPATLKQLRVWHEMAMARLEYFSSTDRKMIAGYERFWQSCKSAFLILSRNKSLVKWLAKHLAVDAAKRQTESYSLTMNPIILTPPSPEPVTESFQLPDTPLELPGRIQMLKNFLASMAPDDPQRPKFQRMLECLERGEKLPDENPLP
jgi:hypothetical protein